jgi:hypothetical protein
MIPHGDTSLSAGILSPCSGPPAVCTEVNARPVQRSVHRGFGRRCSILPLIRPDDGGPSQHALPCFRLHPLLLQRPQVSPTRSAGRGGALDLGDQSMQRPSRTWGSSRRAAERTAGPPLGDRLSRPSVPLAVAVRTFSMRWAPRGNQRMCCCAFIRRCNSHCTVLSMTAVEIGPS